MYRVALCSCVLVVLLQEVFSTPAFNFGGDWFNNNNKNNDDDSDKFPFAKKHVEKQLHIHGHRHHHHHHHHHTHNSEGDTVRYAHHSTDDISLPEIKNFEKALFESSNLAHDGSDSIISIPQLPHESNSIIAEPQESHSVIPKVDYEKSFQNDPNPGLSSYRSASLTGQH